MDELQNETGDTVRERIMTESGKQYFLSQVDDYSKKIRKSWESFEAVLEGLDECSKDLKTLRNIEKTILQSEEKYNAVSKEFIQFLSRKNDNDSNKILVEFSEEFNKCSDIVKRTLKRVRSAKLEVAETMSKCSSDNSKDGTVTSSVLAKKRAVAEVQKTKVQFAKQEAELIKQKARLSEIESQSKAVNQRKQAEVDADLSLLKVQTEAAIALAEVKVLEEAEGENQGNSVCDPLPQLNTVPLDQVRSKLTQDYVNEQYTATRSITQPETACSFETPAPRNKLTIQPTPKTISKPIELNKNLETLSQPGDINNNDSTFVRPSFSGPRNDQSAASDFTKYLLKRDLLLSRFQRFDDRAENYYAWKASFKSITEELSVTVFEEIDLLIKWLGPDSSRFSQTIRVSNANNPDAGLLRIWERLDERFGRPEMVESAIKIKLQKFSKLNNKDSSRYYELLDILTQIQSTKENPEYATLFAYYDSSSGIIPIIDKLPYNIQEKWTSRASNYKISYQVPFPPFSFFVNFVREICVIKNDPAFNYHEYNDKKVHENRKSFQGTNAVLSRRTDVVTANTGETENRENCPIHKANHSLVTCRAFKAKSYEERKQILKDSKICFKCCKSTKHVSRNCMAVVKCDRCNSNSHLTIMHRPEAEKVSSVDGGEASSKHRSSQQGQENVSSKCTSLCGFSGRSCGKTILVNVYPKEFPDKAIRVYAILDDQSNKTLAKPALFDKLGVNTEMIEYTMSTCSGQSLMTGRCASNIIVETISGGTSLNLASVLECETIPNERSEIATPDVVVSFPHLKSLVDKIPELNDYAEIQLLIGRDIPEAHHVRQQIVGPKGTPFAQEMALGWVIVGDVCLGKVHKPRTVNVNRTHIMSDGRGTIFEPCKNNFFVQECDIKGMCTIEDKTLAFSDDPVFIRSKNDEKIGTSVEDREFLAMMDKEFEKDSNNHWTAPLPFKPNRRKLPNNREVALRRAYTLDNALKKDSTRCAHFVEFMRKIIDNKAAEVAPPISSEKECWYLPLFGVYHPNKPTQIRGVFDSSAVFKGVSLNSVMMTGPDLTNSLLGILLRFRRDKVAATVDIEQMFYQFFVRTKDRDFLRFFWYRDNNPKNPLIEFRMCVHVFGNSPSPAVATYGLRRTVENSNPIVKSFIHRDFYVDDGLVSMPQSDQVINIIKQTQEALQSEGNIRLHKITSNSSEVIKAFPTEDLGKDIKQVNLCEESFPVQHSLGLAWDLNTDDFIFNPLQQEKPFTRRGILSSLNSIFDPIGFLSPLTVSGKILLREASPPGTNWDDPLSVEFQDKWTTWRNSILKLQEFHIPRMYFSVSASNMSNLELLIFSDASEKAIAASVFLRGFDNQGQGHVGFVIGKSKLAPSSGNTIPRLELCGAVLATDIASVAAENLDIPLESVKYFCDSKVVLGYIQNKTRRFHTYVSNRVEHILRVSNSEQWSFVPTHLNPADCGTRYISTIDMSDYKWIKGTSFIERCGISVDNGTTFPLVEPEFDKELKPEVKVTKTSFDKGTVKSIIDRIENFSNWRKLIKSVALLKHVTKTFRLCNQMCKGWHYCQQFKTVEAFKEAELFVIKEAQKESFSSEIESLSKRLSVSKQSSIISLSPFLDTSGVLRVGGRLNKLKGSLSTGEINPIIIPKNSHLSKLLIDHYHNSVKHQGRHFSEGALRSAGYWIIGIKRALSSFIQNCVICRRLRGKLHEQKMSDLPEDRLTPGPPFTYVGLDTFGPWHVLTRKTRYGSSNSKRWAILFTCLTTRAVHIELIESLSSSAFINALRRFQSLRGPVKVFRSDRGSNFIGATDDLKVEAIHVEDKDVKNFLLENGSTWIFNPPHSSHMGGVWERMIGVTRRILDSVILTTSSKTLTDETLSTFMAEVVAIINSRPIAQISSDPDMPLILSPSMLLTGKQEYLPVVVDSFDIKDIYKAQWKHVRLLSDIFWKNWRSDYLNCLQQRRKWHNDTENLKTGDVVLLREKCLHRCDWPLGIIVEAIPSSDGKVRKACVRIWKDGKSVTYTRPISEMVLLIN